MTIVENKSIQFVDTGFKDGAFNLVYNANAENELQLRKTIAQVRAHFDSVDRKFYWWVGPYDTPSNVSEVLESEGFLFLASTIPMYLDIRNALPPKVVENAYDDNENIEIRKVENLDMLRDMSVVMATESGAPQETVEFYSRMRSRILSKSCRVFFYIAYYEGQPAGAGVVGFSDSCAGLYCISTLPDFRKKGIATKLTCRMIYDAKKRGNKFIILQSTQQGKSIYDMLGFKETGGSYSAYQLKRKQQENFKS